MGKTAHMWSTEDSLGHVFSPSTKWFLEVELKLLNLAASLFTHKVLLLAPKHYFMFKDSPEQGDHHIAHVECSLLLVF